MAKLRRKGFAQQHGSGNNGPPEVYDNPPNSGEYRIVGFLNDYAPVLEQLDDAEGFRWWKIDLSQPEIVTLSADDIVLPEVGWIYAGVASLHGECGFPEN